MKEYTGKYVFVAGGVCSSLGKGIAVASIGALLETRGYAVQTIKIDPYINVDAGTMNPYQHGEVYVTDDGSETDLDLGNYTRYTNAKISAENSITTGQIYQEVIKGEREGKYLGRTVQVVPHITDCIKKRIFRVGEQEPNQITLVEVGGTIGDIESYPFIEAIRQINHELYRHDTCSILLTLLPQLANGELKTKPTQHSLKELRSIGVYPQFILCRSSHPLTDDLKAKIEQFSDVQSGCVISSHNVDYTYEVIGVYKDQKLDEKILQQLDLPIQNPVPEKINKWNHVVHVLKNPDKEVHIAMVGKYTELSDSYCSIDEALMHGGIAHKAKVSIHKTNAEDFDTTQKSIAQKLKTMHGIIIPGGFGDRGIKGMIHTAEFARTHNIPFFGICLGLQIMVIEYARNILGWKTADSTEFKQETEYPVISLLEEQQSVIKLGGTMRLGANNSILQEHTIIRKAYNTSTISERHRHRYEVSNKYKQDLEDKGLIIAATTEDKVLVESVQWPHHLWGVGVQFHPEFKSMPIYPHPLFSSFIGACLKKGVS